MKNNKLSVKKNDQNVRLDIFLVKRYPDKSRNFFQNLIKKGDVVVNNQHVIAKHIVKEGDSIKISFPLKKKLIPEKENINLDVVFENEDIAVVNKPAGMVVHPGEAGEHVTGSLANALLYHFGKNNLSNVNGPKRPGIVHRLDKDTSGLLIIAKNNKIHGYIASLLKERSVEKHYIALVFGRIKHEKGIIDSPIIRSGRDRKKMTITTENEGKEAITEFAVDRHIREDKDTFTLLNIRLHTGRTHQIRVHFASIGYPIVGDITYGNKKINNVVKLKGLNRQFLHASKIKFKMPDGEIIEVESALPQDLKKFLKNKLGKN